MGNGATYEAYKKRRQNLMQAYSQSPYPQLRQEIGQVGRETQRIAKQTGDTLKRQNVPLGARIEGARQLQTDYAQNIGSAFERVSVQDQQRKQGIMQQLDEVDAKMAELDAQQGKGLLNTGIQVASTLAGAGLGLVVSGGNPVGALKFAQYGASAGQAISGVAGIASGDASEQDWANVGQGIISGVSTLSEQSNLKSIKAENAEAQQMMNDIYNDDTLEEWQRDWKLQQIQLALTNGTPVSEISGFVGEINQGNQ